MRRLPLLLLAAACSDPGPRDRSLLARAENDLVAGLSFRVDDPGRKPSTSVIGLVPDPLAPHYAEGADLVLRFADLDTLRREAAPRIEELRKLLPDLRLPGGEPAELLRNAIGLPKGIVFDPARPFAFVRVRGRWAAVVPASGRESAGKRVKALDDVYCVAGPPEVVDAYAPSLGKGFHLPGDLSVIGGADAVPFLAGTVADLLAERGLPAEGLRSLPPVPRDIERVDLALRFAGDGLRIDLRLAPDRESPTGVYLERMRPRRPASARWLPPDAVLTFDLGSAPLEWEGLVLNLLGPGAVPEETAELRALQRFLATVGQDASLALKLDGQGNGMLYLVAELVDPDGARTFLESSDLRALLGLVAGPGGQLDWKPRALERHRVPAGSVTGGLDRARLEAWRQGTPLEATLGVLLWGPAVAYVAVDGNRLCVVVGPRARVEMERLLDRVHTGKPGPALRGGLFPEHLAAASANLAALFDGARGAASYWHPNGRALKDLSLRWKIPASFAVTSEGGALRAAVRVDPNLLADAVVKIRQALAPAGK